MQPPQAGTVHASAFLVGDRGILVFGPSGAGKSALALETVTAARGAGLFAALVTDDRAHLSAVGGRLLAEAPERLRGGLEVRGAGLFAVAVEPSAIVHLVVRLVSEGDSLRYPDGKTETVEGIVLPSIHVRGGAPEAARRAVMARLLLAPWGRD
jgi:serine kinase of HPr protein (carbohydrate metabolism regulator)